MGCLRSAGRQEKAALSARPEFHLDAKHSDTFRTRSFTGCRAAAAVGWAQLATQLPPPTRHTSAPSKSHQKNCVNEALDSAALQAARGALSEGVRSQRHTRPALGPRLLVVTRWAGWSFGFDFSRLCILWSFRWIRSLL